MSGSPPLVSAVQFGYRYRQGEPWAVHDIDLHLDQGTWLLLAGATGSGKSTLARALNGTVPHFYGGQVAGMLNVCGIDPAEVPMSTIFRHVGVLFQDPAAQLFGTTVERELTFGLESSGLALQEIRIRVEDIIATLGIADLLHRAPQTLSGGEQQLILLAAFLALAPQLLVLDEPMTMLDVHARRQVHSALQTIHAHHTGLIVIDHRLDEYGGVATSFALMEGGTITCHGDPADVVAALLRSPGVGVAPPSAALWWCERVLPMLRRYMIQDIPIPLNSRDAQKQIERLPAGVLEDLRSAPPSQAARVGRPQKEPEGEIFAGSWSAPLVEWRNVSYTYTLKHRDRWFGNTSMTTSMDEGALHDVSSVLRPGEIVALLGPNGAGKSTLLRTLNGLVRPQRGEVHICGQRVGHRPVAELARIVGYAPQRPERLFFCSTVADEVAAGPRALGVEATTKAWQATLVEALDLEPFLKRSPYTLSVGQQRRVGLAAVLAAKPRVVALDEPTAGLDASARAVLATLLRELTTTGASVVVVTHDVDFAATVASRWLVLVAGRLVADDTPARIMANEALLTEAALEPSAFHYLDFWLNQRLTRDCTTWG